MPCMCGDLYCPSCGPAQGNAHCPHCGAWTADGGCQDPAKCSQAEREFCEAEYRNYLIEKAWERECVKRKCVIWELPDDVMDKIDNMTNEQLEGLKR